MQRNRGTTPWALAWRECRARRTRFLLQALAVGVGAAALVAALASLRAHDRATEAILAQHEGARRAGLRRYDDDLQQAMRRLGFNLVLLPAGQSRGDYHADGVASATMPEEDVGKLAAAGLVTVEQWVPVLRRKVRWAERNWTVVVQAQGPPQGRLAAPAAAPELCPVPRGSVDLGCELGRGLGLRPGDRLQFLGAPFMVRACRPETGTPDDITVWMDLAEAQERLNLRGRVSEIRALECRTAGKALGELRAEIARLLPGVTVLEERGETLTAAAARDAFDASQQALLEQARAEREEQRLARTRLAWTVCPLALALAAGASLVLAWANACERRVEVGLWAALGATAGQVQRLLLWRSLLATSAGAAAGVALACPWWGWPGLGTLAGWAALSLAASWLAALPAGALVALLAWRLDPAAVLKNEV